METVLNQSQEKLSEPGSRAFAGEALHPLQTFWAHAYRGYQRPLQKGLGFHVPSFPGALVSPNFPLGSRSEFLAENRGLISHFNEIVPLGHDQRGPAPVGFHLAKQFFLGRKRTEERELPPGLLLEVVNMKEAIERKEFWILLTDAFPKDAPFLRALLPFLCTLPVSFRTAFLREKEKALGLVSVGAGGGAALVLNELVALSERGRGLSQCLSDAALNLAHGMGAKEAFFWTQHAFLGRHADRYDHYRIFERL